MLLGFTLALDAPERAAAVAAHVEGAQARMVITRLEALAALGSAEKE